MLRYYYINKEWMLSGTARHIYRAAAILSLALIPFFFLEPFFPDIPDTALTFLKVIFLGAVLGAATTVVAMEYFLFGFDKSSSWKKAFWFCVMAVPPLGPALYCLIVYSRSEDFKAKNLLGEEETRARC